MDGRSMSRFGRRVAVAVTALAVTLPVIAARADAYIYWSTNNNAGQATIGRAPLSGNATPQVEFIGGLMGARALAITKDYIYWANGANAIGRADINGTNVNDSFLISVGIGIPTALAVDETNGYIYWSNQATGTIGQAPLTGDSTQIKSSFIDPLGVPSGLAVDKANGFLYWTLNSSAGNGRIGRAPLTGGGTPNRTYLVGLFGAQGITVDDTYLYWANGPSSIGRAPLDGSTAPLPNFISGARVGHRSTSDPSYTPTGMAVDGSFVYWGDHVDVTIGRASKDGTGVNNLFQRAFLDPTGVAVDGLTTVTPGPQPPQPPLAISLLTVGVQYLELPHGIERSLLAKLDAGQQALDAGDRDGACDSLNAYINATKAQSGKKIEPASAAGLIADATALGQSLGCDAG